MTLIYIKLINRLIYSFIVKYSHYFNKTAYLLMISMSTKTKTFLPTDTYEIVLSSLIMYLGMAMHICFLGERVPTIWERASIRSFRSMRPYMIHKLTERFVNHVAILSLFALKNTLRIIYFHF